LESSRLGLPPTDPMRAVQAAARYRAMQQPVRDLQREDGPPDLVAFAGQLAPVAQASEHYLPLGMGSFFVSSQADTTGRAPLTIVNGTDDLATTYGSTLFLDEALVPNPAAQSRTATTLDQQATDRYSLQHLRLRGIHSLYPLEEVALIAVPDAIHVAWTAAPVIEPPPPVEPAEEPPPDRSRFHACITAPATPNDDGSPPDATGNGQTATNRDDLADLPILAFHEEADRILDFAGTYATLLEVHQALVNVGQARRNWVAILTLPEHFGVRHCRAWTTALRERLGLPAHSAAYRGPANLADLSYAAVYHPWLTTTDALGNARGDVLANGPGNTAGAIRRVPPDGAVCGVIAAHAVERGVWVAPANVPLQRVLGLQPPIADAEWAELFALGINLIRPEPLDFRVMSAHTLSDEREWLQLSVRRLLILLRKVALERGMAYVFENNDEQLRNAITLTFDQLLQRLFALGALAGATPQQGYRIVHDQRNNSASDRENGRFFVDIQVAPAQPLEFITVRLLRNTDGELQFSELT